MPRLFDIRLSSLFFWHRCRPDASAVSLGVGPTDILIPLNSLASGRSEAVYALGQKQKFAFHVRFTPNQTFAVHQRMCALGQ